MDNRTQSLPEATQAPREAAAYGSLAKGLGWFSIALGVAEIVMPRKIAEACGLRRHGALVRLYGLREIATGVGILTSVDAAPWLWARVGGDMLDMATVATDRSRRASLTRTGATMANLATVAAVDLYAANAYRGPPPRRGIDYPDYSDRSGFPRPAEEMRGVAQVGSDTGRMGSDPGRVDPGTGQMDPDPRRVDSGAGQVNSGTGAVDPGTGRAASGTAPLDDGTA